MKNIPTKIRLQISVILFLFTNIISNSLAANPHPGLQNFSGTNCFMNASIQMLSNTQPISEVFKKIPQTQITKTEKEFVKLINELQTQQDKVSSPAALYNAILTEAQSNQTIKRNFGEKQQAAQKQSQQLADNKKQRQNKIAALQSAQPDQIKDLYKSKQQLETEQEVLVKKIKEETLKELSSSDAAAVDKTVVQTILDHKNNNNEQQDAREFIEQFLGSVNKNILEPCTLKIETNMTDEQKHIISTSTDILSDLLLDFPASDKLKPTDKFTLNDLLKLFTTPEELDYVGWCDSCNKLSQKASRKKALASVPNVLIIPLKRFQISTTGAPERINNTVEFPFEFDITDYLTYDAKRSVKNTKYNLIGFVCQIGSLSGGHYYTYAKHINDGKWYQFNDSIVTEASDTEIKGAIESRSPYILFYQQQETKLTISQEELLDLYTAKISSTRNSQHIATLKEEITNDTRLQKRTSKQLEADIKKQLEKIQIVEKFFHEHKTFLKSKKN